MDDRTLLISDKVSHHEFFFFSFTIPTKNSKETMLESMHYGNKDGGHSLLVGVSGEFSKYIAPIHPDVIRELDSGEFSIDLCGPKDVVTGKRGCLGKHRLMFTEKAYTLFFGMDALPHSITDRMQFAESFYYKAIRNYEADLLERGLIDRKYLRDREMSFDLH